jgi:hypothetical protein
MNDGAQTLAAPARTLKARIERKYPAVAISPKTAHRSFRSVELKCFLKCVVRRGSRFGYAMRAVRARRQQPVRRRVEMKSTSEQSLRYQVEKWLAPGSTAPVHVMEFSRTRVGHRRYVRVETSQPTGTRSLFFFRHDDGYWCVVPPDSDRAKMHVERLAA